MTETRQAKHEAFIVQYYGRTKHDRGNVRGGMLDAAHMCDAIADDILREHTNRAKPTKLGRQLADAVRRAADAIMSMRGMV